eukprot:5073059-Lingulodinium_polyedra.AAC.1
MHVTGRLRVPADSEAKAMDEEHTRAPEEAAVKVVQYEEGELTPAVGAMPAQRTVSLEQLITAVACMMGAQVFAGKPPRGGLAYKLAASSGSQS